MTPFRVCCTTYHAKGQAECTMLTLCSVQSGVVDYGFLEFNHPTYEAAVERMYAKGIRKIYALPVILFAGSHAKNDIPYELNTLQGYHDDLTISMGKHIGVSSFLLEPSIATLVIVCVVPLS